MPQPPTQRPKSANIRLTSMLLDLLHDVRIHRKSFMQYFLLLKGIALLGYEERKYLIDRGLIRALVDFYQDEKPLKDFNVKTVVVGSYLSGDEPRTQKINPPFTANALSLLSVLVRSCETLSFTYDENKDDKDHKAKGDGPPGRMPDALCRLHPTDRAYVFGGIDPQVKLGHSHPHRLPVIQFMLHDPAHVKSGVEIVCYWSWMNEKASTAILTLTVDTLHAQMESTRAQSEGQRDIMMHTFFTVFEKMLLIRDHYQVKRVDYGLNRLFRVLDKAMSSREPHLERFLIFAMKALLRLSLQDASVRRVMDTRKSVWLSWQQKYERVRTQHTYASHHGQWAFVHM